jgi:hypothetical protein
LKKEKDMLQLLPLKEKMSDYAILKRRAGNGGKSDETAE